MQRGLVSVIMPVYNGEPYLARALGSVLQQTYSHWEVVAVDDGSTDRSSAVLSGFADPRIRMFQQVNSGSVGYVRNVCMTHARGEYLAFLDQDDWWTPEKLRRQVEVMESSARVGLVHTDVRYFYEKHQEFGGPLDPQLRANEAVGACFERLLMGNPVCNSSVMVRRQAIDDVGMCDLQIPGNTVQDYDLWLRIAARYELGYLADELTIYCVHPTQGLWDRRKMLTAELDVLLRVREEAWWRGDPERRRRLAAIYDSLAVAHLEQGGYAHARRLLRKASQVEPSLRSRTRYLASLLPRWLVGTLRAVKGALASRAKHAPNFSR